MKKMNNENIKGKKVLFISTKNVDYIRNVQEINFLKKNADFVDIIAFEDKSYLLRIIKVWRACLFKSKKTYDVIFVGFAPQLVFPFLIFWNRNKTLIIDFFISMYDTFVCDRTYFKKNGLIARVLHWIDEITLKNCNLVIVDTLSHGEFFEEEFHVNKEKLEVLYLEADTEIYDINKYCVSKKIKDTVVLYFGSILPLQGVDIILAAVKLLKQNENIRFVIIGPINSVNTQEYPNTEFYTWLSQEELAEKIANADICLAGHFNAHIDKAKRTIAGKTYIYEAMKKKMILGENNANRELFVEDDRHFFVEMGSAEALAEKICEVCLSNVQEN